MPLLYRAVRHLLRAGLELYFVDVVTAGLDAVPPRGPVVFAANHPNSIMDAVVLGTQVPRPISYLARSGLFRNPLLAALFHSAGVIPIYRRQDGPTPEGANEDAFRACHALLEQGGALGIFPEGQNAPERQVRDIKTGVARIALQAEARNDFGLGVRIVPVGLNFQDRDAFLTRVLVRFGEPIEARDHAEAWRRDEQTAVRELTQRVQDSMRLQAVHIHHGRNTRLVKDLHDIHAEAPPEGTTPRKEDRLERWFASKQAIADALEKLEAERPAAVESLRARIRRYKDRLAHERLRKYFVDRPPSSLSVRREAVKMTLYALLLAPVALWGLLHNFVPYRVTRRLALRAPDEAMRAITAFALGAFVFGLTYALIGWGIEAASGTWWWAFAYLITLPPAGIFYLRWRRQLARHRDRIVVRNLFRATPKALRRLVLEREQLSMEVEQLVLAHADREQVPSTPSSKHASAPDGS